MNTEEEKERLVQEVYHLVKSLPQDQQQEIQKALALLAKKNRGQASRSSS